ncbi:cupin domain-containing protein [Jannaschia sp. 2305UL9-9]|uniref:cupin domain-containing protein n=1 Tax=Jannaschia sp. 2305UL9-9 TaxID=3121638 RepID=UPI00352741EA
MTAEPPKGAEGYVLKASDIERMAGLAKTHFLNPSARRVNKSLGDATGLTGLGIHLIEVAPGDETTEFHVHHHEDEAVYVIAGTATAQIGEEHVEIGPGDFIGYRAGGLPHTIVNTGAEPLRCLVVGQRLAHDVGDYPRQGKRIFRQAGLPWNLVDHDRIETPTGGAKT